MTHQPSCADVPCFACSRAGRGPSAVRAAWHADQDAARRRRRRNVSWALLAVGVPCVVAGFPVDGLPGMLLSLVGTGLSAASAVLSWRNSRDGRR